MKTKIIILLTLLAVLATSCLKFERYALTNVEKQMIPYKLGQIVSCIDSTGQAVDVTVTYAGSMWWARDGREHFEKIEHLSVGLLPELKNFSFTLEMTGDYEDTNYNIITIIIRPFDAFSTHGFGCGVSFNKEGQFLTETEQNDYKQYFYDSLEINNKIYYDVVDRIVNANKPYYPSYGYDKRLPVRLLYNKTYGILQFEDKDKVLFTINN